MILRPRNPAHAEILGKLQVEREIGWETKAVRRADVVLKNVNGGIREACMEVKDRAGGNFPGDLEPAPGDEPVGDVAGQGPEKIGTDDRLFKGHVNGGERVQVPAGKAVNIRNVEVDILSSSEAQGGFKLVIARRAGVAEEEDGAAGGTIHRIDNELFVGAAAQK